MAPSELGLKGIEPLQDAILFKPVKYAPPRVSQSYGLLYPGLKYPCPFRAQRLQNHYTTPPNQGLALIERCHVMVFFFQKERKRLFIADENVAEIAVGNFAGLF